MTGAAPTSQNRRAVVSSFVGTAIEWYEFFIYGTAAALYFPAVFFSGEDPIIGTLIAFATFGVAFVARPIGALVFGHLGDRLGRKTTLITTLLMMGIATGLIGLLPSYAQIGIAAPILLVALRIIQGLAVGGEWGGAVLVAVEHAPDGKRRLYGSAPQIGSPIGLVLATGVMALVTLLPEEDRLEYGWRIPFIAGFVLVFIGFLIRRGVSESKEFTDVKTSGIALRVPFVEVLRSAKGALATGIGLNASVNVVFYIVGTYFISYGTAVLGLEQSQVLLTVMAAALIDAVLLGFAARLADAVGPVRVFAVGAVSALFLGFVFFALIGTLDPVVIFVAVLGTMILGHVTTYSVLSSMVADLFPAQYRYSGVAASNAFGALLFSAPVPLLAAALFAATGSTIPVALMATVAGVASIAAVLGYLQLRKAATATDPVPVRTTTPVA